MDDSELEAEALYEEHAALRAQLASTQAKLEAKTQAHAECAGALTLRTKELLALVAKLEAAEKELKAFRKEKFAADSGIHPEYQRGVSDERRRSHSDIKTIQLEKIALAAALKQAREALVNLRGWAVANTNKPIHDLLAVTDAALSTHPDSSLLGRILSKEPSPGLLMSMAIRYDHALAMPGYYDQPHFEDQPSHKRMVESTISIMRQLYEEVSGNGFYSEEKEADYCKLLADLGGQQP